MSMWGEALNDLNAIDTSSERLSVDQRLKVVEIKALLSISQELSGIRHEGINPEFRQ